MARPQSTDQKLSQLTRLAEKGFAAIASDLALLPTKSDLAPLATKADVRKILAEEVVDLRHELAAERREFEELNRIVLNIVALPKEIDHALARIAAIERHLGIDRKIAA